MRIRNYKLDTDWQHLVIRTGMPTSYVADQLGITQERLRNIIQGRERPRNPKVLRWALRGLADRTPPERKNSYLTQQCHVQAAVEMFENEYPHLNVVEIVEEI